MRSDEWTQKFSQRLRKHRFPLANSNIYVVNFRFWYFSEPIYVQIDNHNSFVHMSNARMWASCTKGLEHHQIAIKQQNNQIQRTQQWKRNEQKKSRRDFVDVRDACAIIVWRCRLNGAPTLFKRDFSDFLFIYFLSFHFCAAFLNFTVEGWEEIENERADKNARMVEENRLNCYPINYWYWDMIHVHVHSYTYSKQWEQQNNGNTLDKPLEYISHDFENHFISSIDVLH